MKFIVGSRVTKAPADLANHFHWDGDVLARVLLRRTAPCSRLPGEGMTGSRGSSALPNPIYLTLEPLHHNRIAKPNHVVVLDASRAQTSLHRAGPPSRPFVLAHAAGAVS